MCRLYGMSAAPHRVRATFWLLEAPDSLLAQSRRDPDGTGIGYFAADGTPRIDKRPIAAFADRAFAREARELHSETFVAHIREATTGALRAANTHPFEQRGRLLAAMQTVERELSAGTVAPQTDIAIRPHRIGVDSGAYVTGKLSAIYLEDDRQEFISVA